LKELNKAFGKHDFLKKYFDMDRKYGGKIESGKTP
jgi:hypothetical protein